MFSPYKGQIPFRMSAFQQIPTNAVGIYGIWYRRYCIYIGQTKSQSISKRLEQHWKGSHNSNLRLWIETKGSELSVWFQAIQNCGSIDQVERYCIQRFQPVTNTIRYKNSACKSS